MTKQRKIAALTVVALAVVIATGGLVASNMGFKLNYPLLDSDNLGSESGNQTLGLPYNRQVGIDSASGLFRDIGTTISNCGAPCNCVSTISRYDTATDVLFAYSCNGFDYALEPGTGLLIKVLQGKGGDYIVVGSHNPATVINIACPGNAAAPLTCCGSANCSGNERYVHPYHAVSATAAELMTELGGFNFVSTISRYDTGSDILIAYSANGFDYPLVAGQSYLIKTLTSTQPNGIEFTPAHY
jgi:hypothetical protein